MKRLTAVVFLILCAALRAQTQPSTQPALVHAARDPQSHTYLLHLPGIGGWMKIDTLLTRGLREGGVDGQIDIYDWTNGNPGMPALGAYDRNRAEAKRVAEMILARIDLDPDAKVILTGHSAGAGVAVWALENLPDGKSIDTLVMIAPALSPGYDLTSGLRHVKRAYVFVSDRDPVLGAGTRTFGTIDRVKTDAAGRVGFVVPDSDDARQQYQKLRTFTHNRAWSKFSNWGDHIGAMMRPFARAMIGPLLVTGELPQAPTTGPSSQPAR